MTTMMMMNNLGGLDISGKSHIAGKVWIIRELAKSLIKEKKQQQLINEKKGERNHLSLDVCFSFCRTCFTTLSQTYLRCPYLEVFLDKESSLFSSNNLYFKNVDFL